MVGAGNLPLFWGLGGGRRSRAHGLARTDTRIERSVSHERQSTYRRAGTRHRRLPPRRERPCSGPGACAAAGPPAARGGARSTRSSGAAHDGEGGRRGLCDRFPLRFQIYAWDASHAFLVLSVILMIAGIAVLVWVSTEYGPDKPEDGGWWDENSKVSSSFLLY
jgi:hypothetical protein